MATMITVCSNHAVARFAANKTAETASCPMYKETPILLPDKAQRRPHAGSTPFAIQIKVGPSSSLLPKL
jgi:hypothetical protein